MTRLLLSLIPAAACLALGPVPARAPMFQPIQIVDARPPSVERLLVEAALRYELPIRLLFHRAWMESKLDTQAVRDEGWMKTWGVMQLSDRFFPGAESMSVAANIDAGAAYLKGLLTKCEEDWDCAERAYRTGKVRR